VTIAFDIDGETIAIIGVFYGGQAIEETLRRAADDGT
jgi:hypothetical protein